MKIEPLPLFGDKKEVVVFFLGVFLLFLVSLGIEYGRYLDLARFDDAVVRATVLRQYTKTKADRTYQVLKLRTDGGAAFYMTASPLLRDLDGYEVDVWLRTDRLTFFDYLKGFFARGYVEAVFPRRAAAYREADKIAAQHAERDIGALFAALFTATPIPPSVRTEITALGVGHLLAISGFHIGLLSTILYALMYYPYRMAQSYWFPWRSRKRDLFFLTAVVMLGYVVFLGMPPSVLRAYAMMLVGFVLYDRGIRLLSFQSLAVSAALLIALWPRLLFSMGFWLSVAGVFYLFAFLRRFAQRGKTFTFIGLHVWVYAMMLPISLALFGVFSPLHPLSILWTMLFIPFYPLALALHLVGMGGSLDPAVEALLALPGAPVRIEIAYAAAAVWAGLSLLAVKSETVERLLPYLAAAVFVGAVYQIA